jgi:tetratricopeptide (TPR) repeat protein
MSRHTNAVSALVQFLDAFPTDAEAWCELAELYQAQAMLSQAIFCLEEALLIVPNAWNVSLGRKADPTCLPSCLSNRVSAAACETGRAAVHVDR